MPFQTVPVNISGPTYKDRSRPLASQESRNMYHEVVEPGKDRIITKSFPGQRLINAPAVGVDRGSHQMLEVQYRVAGLQLFEVLRDGTHIMRGTIPGADRCIFADDGINLYIVSDFIVTKYNSTTQVLSEVTDPNIKGAKSVAFINNQFAYTFDLITVFSDVGDGSSATSLNAIGEESHPDNLVRDYTFESILYRFGDRSTVPWYNNPSFQFPPFARVEGQYISIGLAAIHAVSNTRDFLYWLGSDKQIYRTRGGQEQVISSAAISGAIQGYSVVSDAFMEVFTIDNKQMVMITFPTEDVTWCLNEELGVDGWFNLTSGINDVAYNAGSIVEVYGKVRIGDSKNGKMYDLDFNTYNQGGNPWKRRRVLGSVNGDIFGQKGKRVQMSRIEFIIETGTGLLTGQGDDPVIMLEYSTDGARSWQVGDWLKIGRQGEFDIRLEWWSLISFYDLIIRLSTTDAIALNVYSAAIDLRLAGR